MSRRMAIPARLRKSPLRYRLLQDGAGDSSGGARHRSQAANNRQRICEKLTRRLRRSSRAGEPPYQIVELFERAIGNPQLAPGVGVIADLDLEA